VQRNWLLMLLATQRTVILNRCLKSLCYDLEFHVVDRHITPLLGLMDSLSLNLIHLHSEVHEVDTVDAFRAAILNKYKNLFYCDLGNLPVVCKMSLDPDVIPVVRPSHKVPLTMEECQRELEKMDKIGAIARVGPANRKKKKKKKQMEAFASTLIQEISIRHSKHPTIR